jgi:hypothetical protein
MDWGQPLTSEQGPEKELPVMSSLTVLYTHYKPTPQDVSRLQRGTCSGPHSGVGSGGEKPRLPNYTVWAQLVAVCA